jgi:alanine racemase
VSARILPPGRSSRSVRMPASRIEISRSAYRGNLDVVRSVVGPDRAISSVVKGNAYGHGIRNIVELAEEWGVRHFSVFHAGEAQEVLDASRAGSSVMVMGFLSRDELAWAVEHGVSFFAFDLERIHVARELAERTGTRARVHLDLETGMNRIGLSKDEYFEALEVLRASPDTLAFAGLCTHYAGAESEGNYLRIQRQIGVFEERSREAAERGLQPELQHTACSAALFTYPQTRLDLVRVGIAQYGLWPSQETRMRFLLQRAEENGTPVSDPLHRVMRWVSSVMAVKTVEAGEFVGYGRSYQATRRQRIATIPVGYGNGFPRVLSNLGYVLVRGKRAPVVGLVNMNLTTLDVTEIPNVKPGDEVVLIGRQRREEIPVAWFGDITRMLNYEVLVRIPRDVPRVLVP